MHGLRHKSLKVVKLVHRLHHGCPSGDHGAPSVPCIGPVYQEAREEMRMQSEYV